MGRIYVGTGTEVSAGAFPVAVALTCIRFAKFNPGGKILLRKATFRERLLHLRVRVLPATWRATP